MAFSFGATPASKPATGFGTTSTGLPGASSLFGGFGGTPASSSAGQGFAGFGAAATTNAFGAATTTTTSSAFGGFGSTAPGFGAGTSTLGTAFGAGTATSTLGTGLGSTGFGTGTTGFGTGTGAFGTTGTSAFGTGTTGFGTGTGSTGFNFAGGTGGSLLGGGLAQQQQQQQAQAAASQQNAGNSMQAMGAAMVSPLLFGDERDQVIAKWNQLQAFYGFGKGFYTQQGAAATFTPDNPFCRFKAVGYSCLPSNKNRDGIVAIVLTKKVEEVQTNQSQIVLILHKILGNKPNLTVCVEGVRPLPDNKCEITIYVQERANTGATKRLLSTEVFNFLNQPNVKTQLGNELTVCEILPKTGLTGEQLKNYLENPPSGIDPLIWEQAKLDNPDPEKLIPVPMIGFSELQRRLKHQEQQTKLHTARMSVISQDITSLQQKQTDMLAKIEQYKRTLLKLGHDILKVMVRQEVHRKAGYAIQADEEQLRSMLEASQAQLNAPTQFKGRLNELMSQIRLQSQTGASRSDTAYTMDDSVQLEVKQHLKQQHEGIQLLINIIKDDLEDLALIEHGLSDAHLH